MDLQLIVLIGNAPLLIVTDKTDGVSLLFSLMCLGTRDWIYDELGSVPLTDCDVAFGSSHDC